MDKGNDSSGGPGSSPTAGYRYLVGLALLAIPAGFIHGADCDGNGRDDLEDTRAGNVMDCNGNGVPDSCESPPIRRPYLNMLRFGAGTFPSSLVTLDLEGDSDLDVVVSNRFQPYMSALVNDGTGRFDERIQVPLPYRGLSLAPADLEGDGDADFMVSGGSFPTRLMAVVNRGGGVLESAWSQPVGDLNGEILAAGDLDGDGDIDVLSGGVTLLQESDGTFTTSFPDSTHGVQTLAAGDFDDDGDIDIAGAVPEVVLFANAGDGSFVPSPSPISAPWTDPSSSTTLDLDADADLDLAVVTDGDIHILVNDGSGRFMSGPAIPFRHRTGVILSFDLDRNGLGDFVVALGQAEALVVFMQTGPRIFSELPILPHQGFPLRVVAGDFDLDGDSDIIAANKDSDDIGLVRGTAVPADLDCNENGNPDECDIAAGVDLDCNGNGLPDACEADCDGDGIPDDCAIRRSPGLDCNLNSVPDMCDLASGTSRDCNANHLPDECEDCNANRLPDPCEIHGRLLEDCDGDSLPDTCDEDCNENGEPDGCDIRSGGSTDGNGNGVPDECEADLRFELRFRGPSWVSMSPGEPGRANAFVQFETSGPREEWPAIVGWDLRVRSIGCRIVDTTVSGTGGDARAKGGYRFFGFHGETLAPADGEDGSILTANMILSLTQPLSLPRGRAKHDLLRLALQSEPTEPCGECILRFEQAPPPLLQTNQLLSLDGSTILTIRPRFEEIRIRFCPTESCSGLASDLCLRFPFHRGDPNGNGAMDISDALFIFLYLHVDGRGPACKEAADTNNDGAIDISDGVLILNYLFLGDEAPAPPGHPPAPCDFDGDAFQSDKDLGCTLYSSC